MAQNVIGTMYIVAMENVKFEDERYNAQKLYVPLTNLMVDPMNNMMVTTDMPLRIGRRKVVKEQIRKEEISAEDDDSVEGNADPVSSK